ncbi:MAG TPA: erythromycin esterase family protein, partial [Gemmatimonadaceae bacterium]|nr:erythromycin esterase family protein [Gemmatimonadaceae bacterium]
MATQIAPAAGAVRAVAHPLRGTSADFDLLLRRIGDAHFVLIGEASHGTHEFYNIRAEITKRLIREKGFTAVAVEADWPDAYRVNRFVRARGDDADAADALAGFHRFPQWMWRNADVLDFVGWLRAYNDTAIGPRRTAGFYGLDLYSLNASIHAVIAYLDRVDPEAAGVARRRYGCLTPWS